MLKFFCSFLIASASDKFSARWPFHLHHVLGGGISPKHPPRMRWILVMAIEEQVSNSLISNLTSPSLKISFGGVKHPDLCIYDRNCSQGASLQTKNLSLNKFFGGESHLRKLRSFCEWIMWPVTGGYVPKKSSIRKIDSKETTKLNGRSICLGYTPHPWCQSPPGLFSFLVGNPYKPLFVTVTASRVVPKKKIYICLIFLDMVHFSKISRF